MKMKYNDYKYMLYLVIVLTIITVHLMLGYVFPVAACIIITISFITVYTFKRRWLGIAWVLLVGGCYVLVDYVTYNPDGISAMLYKYMLSIALAQFYSILLCIACTSSKHRAYRDETMTTNNKVRKIKTISSIFNLYAIPTGITITVNAIYNTLSAKNTLGTIYINSAIVSIIALASINMATYADTVVLVRAIEKSCKKEDDNNEVLQKDDNGESVGQNG